MDNDRDSLEARVYRLETQMTEAQKQLGEVIDRTKNAHHRIDETNFTIKEFKEEMKSSLGQLKRMIDNIGINLAERDKRDKTFKKALVCIAILAGAAFVGMFIRDSAVASTVGEIAAKLGIGVISATI